MLRVTVELIPGGYLSNKRNIRELEITNTSVSSIVGHPSTYKVTSKGDYIDTIEDWDSNRPVEELVAEALFSLRDRPLRDYY
jgi:hypothetical protein